MNKKPVRGDKVTSIVATLNVRGQTKMNQTKQIQLDNLIKTRNLAIILLQECHITDQTFESCPHIKHNFQILKNNAENGYGTGALVHNSLPIQNVKAIPGGRIIYFEIGKVSFCNIYLPSGSAGKADREAMLGKVLPNAMIDSCKSGLVAGDWNCLDNPKDATHNPTSKVSPVLQRLCRVKGWKDCYRSLHPSKKTFSHVYQRQMGEKGLTEGAARLDRAYMWGEVSCMKAEYFPAAFSDHLGLQVNITLPDLAPVVEANFRPYFKVKPEIAADKKFQEMVAETVANWLTAKTKMPLLEWWEVVKIDVKAAAKKITRERKNEKKQELSFLMILQAHLASRVSGGELEVLSELKLAQERITAWFEKRAKDVVLHANLQDVEESEHTLMYHHEKLQSNRKRSSILKLKNKEGVLVEGHSGCASILQEEARALLDNVATLDPKAQEELLDGVEAVFTEEDNAMLEKPISNEDVKASLLRANRNSAPGSDGLSYQVYLKCWDSLGEHLCEVIREIVRIGKMPESMRNSYLVFSPKIGKESSTRIKDKRKLALLQTDFKILSGVLAGRLKKTENHTISPHQFSAGSKRVSHAVCLTRNAIECVKPSDRAALIETDFVSAFDYMSTSWIFKVLRKKGCSEQFVKVLQNLYEDQDTYVTCIINNEAQERIVNKRKNVKQGDRTSTQMYNFASDPLLIKLNKVLKGLSYFKHPTSGPHHPLFGGPRPVEEKLSVLGFVDDVKGIVTSTTEFNILDQTLSTFERATGSKLHRSSDPSNQKCNLLALGRWTKWTQADSPLDYMKVVDYINLLGVKLARTTTKTREINGSELVTSVQSKLNHFKAGRHSDLVLKPHSANCYLLSKISHKAGAVHLRSTDVKKLQSCIRSWVSQELLKNPPEVLLYRDPSEGGLGLVNVHARAMANLIKNFLHMVHESLYMCTVYKAFVLEEEECKALVRKPSFFPEIVYELTKEAITDMRGNIFSLSTKQWQDRLTQRNVTHVRDPLTSSLSLVSTTAEEKAPQIDWSRCWANIRQKGLSPAQKSTLFKLCHGLFPNGKLLHKFKMVKSPICQFCPETDDKMHFMYCQQSGKIGKTVMSALSQASSQPVDPTWEQVGRLDLEFASENDRIAGLILLSESVHHITSQRKKSQKISHDQLAGQLKHRGEVLAISKYFSAASSSLGCWADELSRPPNPQSGISSGTTPSTALTPSPLA